MVATHTIRLLDETRQDEVFFGDFLRIERGAKRKVDFK